MSLRSISCARSKTRPLLLLLLLQQTLLALLLLSLAPRSPPGSIWIWAPCWQAGTRATKARLAQGARTMARTILAMSSPRPSPSEPVGAACSPSASSSSKARRRASCSSPRRGRRTTRRTTNSKTTTTRAETAPLFHRVASTAPPRISAVSPSPPSLPANAATSSSSGPGGEPRPFGQRVQRDPHSRTAAAAQRWPSRRSKEKRSINGKMPREQLEQQTRTPPQRGQREEERKKARTCVEEISIHIRNSLNTLQTN